MIPTIKMNSVSFKSNTATVEPTSQQVVKPKKTAGERFQDLKKGATDALKTINTAVGVSYGTAHGLVEGSIAAGAIGIIGKNAQDGGLTWKTISGIAKDAWNVIKVVPKTIGKLWNNSPKDNIVSAFKTIPDHAKNIANGMKKHKLTAGIALGTGLLITAFRTVQGKVQANRINAGIDHRTNQGHTH